MTHDALGARVNLGGCRLIFSRKAARAQPSCNKLGLEEGSDEDPFYGPYLSSGTFRGPTRSMDNLDPAPNG